MLALKFKQLDSIELPREQDYSSSGLPGGPEGLRKEQVEAVEEQASRNGGGRPDDEPLGPARSAPVDHQDQRDQDGLLPRERG